MASTNSSVDGWDLKPDGEDLEAAHPRRQSFKGDDIANPEVLNELETCFRISERFANLRKKQAKERDWQNALQEHIFTAYQSNDGGSDPFKESNMQRRWELHQETHWTEFNQSSPSDFRDGKSTLTYPVPDFTYGFPIIDITDPVYEPYLKHRLIENFSLPTLHKLREASVLSSPRKALAQWKSSKPTNDQMGGSDLMCFPWAVVEVKSAAKDASIERMCYCQAANASAAALSIREKLHLASKKSDPKLEALVIFSFTCVGTHVKLWLTYTSPEEKVVMQCIWATSLEISWGVFVLRMVLKNMQEWVNQEVRPELARWIEGARGCTTPKVFLSSGGGLIERSRRSASHESHSERPTDSPSLRKSYSSLKYVAKYSQETSQMIRSAAPSPMLSSFSSEYEDEDEEVEEYDDYKDEDYNEEDEDSENSVDEGYYSSQKKKTRKKVTPIASRQSHHSGLTRTTVICSKSDDKGIVNKISSLSFSGKKR
ncbi:hypothetical protein COCMIDRAFT_27181 [Bipolaris oryzae ATCC 44560]|uniref:Uncharacterized protein n=1 Tax=Bipolaris oryzae ATCC 44560 TaxID=930090 RepID=W6Z410_COCMI|nr:uncharacterized protein COCMIDRAFT_27181 [Bipolaris oryzae ATCC 44560]EUC44473.1 hypothetical protein COCMIDRAFT_27181 [Bipolaris oryzae ATCC 44560]